jgi:hypothetical protein
MWFVPNRIAATSRGNFRTPRDWQGHACVLCGTAHKSCELRGNDFRVMTVWPSPRAHRGKTQPAFRFETSHAERPTHQATTGLVIGAFRAAVCHVISLRKQVGDPLRLSTGGMRRIPTHAALQTRRCLNKKTLPGDEVAHRCREALHDHGHSPATSNRIKERSSA